MTDDKIAMANRCGSTGAVLRTMEMMMTDDKIMTADELWEQHGLEAWREEYDCLMLRKYDKTKGKWLYLCDDGDWQPSLQPVAYRHWKTHSELEKAATEIVRSEAKQKVERLDIAAVPTMGELAHLLDKANLYRVTDPDGTVRVVQRWNDEVYDQIGSFAALALSSDEYRQAYADQRAIREVE